LSTEEIKESENPKKIPAAQARQGISGFLFYYLHHKGKFRAIAAFNR
jgi:hypothetical protein